MFKKKAQSEGIIIREKTSSLFEKTLKQSYSALKLIWGGYPTGHPLQICQLVGDTCSLSDITGCRWVCVRDPSPLRLFNLFFLDKAESQEPKGNHSSKAFLFPPWQGFGEQATMVRHGEGSATPGDCKRRLCQAILSSQYGQGEGLQDARQYWEGKGGNPRPWARVKLQTIEPGCLNGSQEEKNWGSWQGSKLKQKILSGRK